MMYNRRWLFWLIVSLAGALVLIPTMPAWAQGGQPGDDGVVIWNEDYTLKEDQQVEGDLVVFNGDATLEANSLVEGSVVVWNGNAEIAGTIEKDLVVSNGHIHLTSSAWVQGDVVCTWNCDLEREEGARLDGRSVEGLPMGGFHWPEFTWTEPPFVDFWASGPGRLLNKAFEVFRALIAVLVIAAIAGLVALVMPQQMAQVGHTVLQAPWASLGVGLLTVLAAIALMVLLVLTICLPPLVAFALAAAGVFGWVCVGALVGERLLVALKVREITPLWAAVLGTLFITLISAGLSVALCLAPLGWLLTLGAGCLGLGGVVLTRFGTRPYVHGSAPPSAL